MADKILNRVTDYAKLTEVEKLLSYAGVAATYESILDDVAAVLHAIEIGDLFASLPAEESDRVNHNAGASLLRGLGDRVRKAQAEIEAAPGTDLFIYLECRAKELPSGAVLS